MLEIRLKCTVCNFGHHEIKFLRIELLIYFSNLCHYDEILRKYFIEKTWYVTAWMALLPLTSAFFERISRKKRREKAGLPLKFLPVKKGSGKEQSHNPFTSLVCFLFFGLYLISLSSWFVCLKAFFDNLILSNTCKNHSARDSICYKLD